jgi:RNA polymerase sigma-70 factor (ECF subfamily)
MYDGCQRTMKASLQTTDEELWRLASAGDEHAFTLLYRRRQGAIYRFAWQMSGSAQIAEDVTQESFMALLREPECYEPARGTLAAYLYGIARRQVLRRLEKERAFVALAAEDEAGHAPSASAIALPDPLADFTRRETVETVRQAVLALPAHYREVILLCDLHELSYAETAAALTCAVGTVRSRLARGRALLCERLRALRPAQAEVEAKRCCA